MSHSKDFHHGLFFLVLLWLLFVASSDFSMIEFRNLFTIIAEGGVKFVLNVYVAFPASLFPLFG